MTASGSGATKRDLIVRGLRIKILSGELVRNSRLRQDEVAEWFDSSITPVREALRILEAEGLVVAEPHRGVRVAGVDLERIKSLYIVRRLTESYAVARATSRISRHELRKAEAILTELDAAIAADEPAARNRLTFEFHCFFYARAGLPALYEDIVQRWRAFPWDYTLGNEARRSTSAEEHRAIIEAVRAGDEEEAGRLMAEHISHGYLSIAEALTGAPVADPFDLDAD